MEAERRGIGRSKDNQAGSTPAGERPRAAHPPCRRGAAEDRDAATALAVVVAAGLAGLVMLWAADQPAKVAAPDGWKRPPHHDAAPSGTAR